MALESLPKIAPALFSAEQDLIQIYNKKSDTTGVINPSYIKSSPSGAAGAIQFSDGSAFASDAANLFWDDTNNRLGIGTNAPLSNLQVNNPTGGTTKISLSGNGIIKSELSLNYGSGECRWHNYGGGYFPTIYSNNSEALRIDNSQNVGIGTTAPTARTHIKGSGSTSATTSLLVQNSSGSNALKITDDAQSFYYGTFGVTQSHFYSNNGDGARRDSDSYSIIDYLRSYGSSYLIYGFSTGNYILDVKDGFSTRVRYPLCVSTSFNIPNASAILQADSYTQGFLPPRMNDAQVRAIVSPAVGLMAYNTDLDCPVFYSAAGWRKVSHSVM